MILRPEDDEDMWHVYNLIAEVGLDSRRLASGSPSTSIGGHSCTEAS